MKGNGGLQVGQRLIEGIALANDNAFQSQWIRDIAIGVFFNDYLEVLFHSLSSSVSQRSVRRAHEIRPTPYLLTPLRLPACEI